MENIHFPYCYNLNAAELILLKFSKKWTFGLRPGTENVKQKFIWKSYKKMNKWVRMETI